MPASSDRRGRARLAPMTLVLRCAVALPSAAHAQGAPAALVGSWWQSAWKLCKPAAQLTPDDVDPPIEDLVFRADGTFSVMWRGSGAHTTDIPHVSVPVPDYSGRYAVDATAGRIRMRIDNGLFVPRDFSGDGAYTIGGNELKLTNLWFGTRRARQKPDICELTFTRK